MDLSAIDQRLRRSLQQAPDFVLDGLWQRFRVPPPGYVDGYTLRVQHVAMIVILRGKVLHRLCGLLFGRRSGPGDELVTNHVRGQLLRRAAVCRDDPATLIPPRPLLPGHHSLHPEVRTRAVTAGERAGPPCLGPMGCENGAGL